MIKDRLEHILEEVDRLKEFLDVPLEEFAENWRDVRSAEHTVQIIAQSIIDIAGYNR